MRDLDEARPVGVRDVHVVLRRQDDAARSVETSVGQPTTTGTRESTGEAVTDGDGVRVDDTAAEGLWRGVARAGDRDRQGDHDSDRGSRAVTIGHGSP